jgi:hypothetical protein
VESAGGKHFDHGTAKITPPHESVLVLIGEELLYVDANIATGGRDPEKLFDDEPHVERKSTGSDIDRRAVIADVLDLAAVCE